MAAYRAGMGWASGPLRRIEILGTRRFKSPLDTPRECKARADPRTNVDGLVLMLGGHPDPDMASERVSLLRAYWPTS